MKKAGLLLVIIQVIFWSQLIATDLDLSPARWIWYPSERTLQNTFILFRKEINIDKDKVSAKGWVIADSRYQLFVNGQRVQWGPAPFDPRWQEADPVEILKTFPSNMGVSYPCNAVWRYWALAENGEVETLMDDLKDKWGKMPSVWENNTLQEDWNAGRKLTCR